MRHKIKHVTVVLNGGKSRVGEVRAELEELLERYNVKVLWMEALSLKAERTAKPGELRRIKTDMVVVGGGDGTMLQTARRILGADIPILGINLGSLGFLTALRRDEIQTGLPAVLEGNYKTSDRIAISATIRRGRKVVLKTWALNEVVAFRGGHAQMIAVVLRVGGELLSRYLCDGMIVSTPTGSTAYSMSAGGPILSPGAAAFSIVPICAHSLTNRPVVTDAHEGIVMEIPRPSPEVVLQTDGLTCCKLLAGDVVEFAVAEKRVQLVHLPEIGFYSILRQKLKWSGTNI